MSKSATISLFIRANNKSNAYKYSNSLSETMKKPNIKQLIMPAIVTFILIVASFAIASKYELKSIIKQPVKINSSTNHDLEVPKMEEKEDIEPHIPETDSTSQLETETHSIFDGTPMKSIPKEVSIILLSRLQVSFSLPTGT